MNDNSQENLGTAPSTATIQPLGPAAGPGTSSQRQTVHEVITARMVELLERGTIPWRSGWTRSPVGAPRSASTGKVYRGINHFLLAVAAQAAGYARSSWITFRQAKDLGGSVRKGEKGLPCIFWRVLDGRPSADEQDAEAADDGVAPSSGRRRFVVRYYTVFNVQQCEGLPADQVDTTTTPARAILPCDAIVSGYQAGPRIDHGFNRACYSPIDDKVSMPSPTVFDTAEAYYATLYHELAHSSGHPDRLGRFPSSGIVPPFGSPDYSREELVAEMGSALLCAEAGISCATLENQAAYVAGWLKVLEEDSRAVVFAAAQAQRAVDRILGRSGGEA
jgi:antirestriction protein ArdC